VRGNWVELLGGESVKITVKFFASYRDIAGRSEEIQVLNEGATVSDLLLFLGEKYPKLGGLTDTIIASVNKKYAREEVVLKEGDEVALLPPVSGG
jgi:molybdopterin converting factor subunit 1